MKLLNKKDFFNGSNLSERENAGNSFGEIFIAQASKRKAGKLYKSPTKENSYHISPPFSVLFLSRVSHFFVVVEKSSRKVKRKIVKIKFSVINLKR